MQLPTTSGLVQSRRTACSLLSLGSARGNSTGIPVSPSARYREILRNHEIHELQLWTSFSTQRNVPYVPTNYQNRATKQTPLEKRNLLRLQGPPSSRVSVCRVLRASLPLLDMRPTQSQGARSGDPTTCGNNHGKPPNPTGAGLLSLRVSCYQFYLMLF